MVTVHATMTAAEDITNTSNIGVFSDTPVKQYFCIKNKSAVFYDYV